MTTSLNDHPDVDTVMRIVGQELLRAEKQCAGRELLSVMNVRIRIMNALDDAC